MKHYLVPIALMVCLMAGSCDTEKKLYRTGVTYHQANQADHERILELKASGRPEAWPEIFERYCSIKGRSDEMSHYPANVKRDLHYIPIDVDEELTLSRNKAEAYLTAKISQLLDSETPNIDEAERRIKDLERVNGSNSRINDFKLKLLAKQYGDLSRLMHLEVMQRSVGPNHDEAVSFTETSDGKTATVTDHNLSKSATIKGKMLFIDPANKKLLFSYPFEMTSNFSSAFTTVEGSMEACSEQTLERLKQPRVPFPTDESLVNDAKRQVINIIYQKIQ